jgi:putative redox protein
MAIRPKSVVDIQMTGTVQSHACTEVGVRGLVSFIDEPPARGGTDRGLTPTETVVAALIGCTNVIAQRIAHRDGITLDDMRIKAHGQFDRRGAALEDPVTVPFVAIRLEVDLASDATPEQIDRLRADLARYCPVSVMLRASGTEIHETWTVRPLSSSGETR